MSKGSANWIIETRDKSLPESFDTFGPFERRRGSGLVAVAPELPLDAPSLTVLSDHQDGEERRVRVRINAPGSQRVVLQAGESAQPQNLILPRNNAGFGARTFVCWGRSCNGLELTYILAPGDNVEFALWDEAPRLPAEARALQSARSKSYTPFQDGDRVVVKITQALGRPAK